MTSTSGKLIIRIIDKVDGKIETKNNKPAKCKAVPNGPREPKDGLTILKPHTMARPEIKLNSKEYRKKLCGGGPAAGIINGLHTDKYAGSR